MIVILVVTKPLHSHMVFIALAEHHLILREFMLPILSTQHNPHVGRNSSEEKVQSNFFFRNTSVTAMYSVPSFIFFSPLSLILYYQGSLNEKETFSSEELILLL